MSARREFLISLGAALLWSLPARAQLPRTMYRIGFLGNTTAALEANLIEPFRQGLRDLGYEEGRNITIEYRWAEGKYERFPALIAELVALNLDVMVTGTPATPAVKKQRSRCRWSWPLSEIPSAPVWCRASRDPAATLRGSAGWRPISKASGCNCSGKLLLACRTLR